MASQLSPKLSIRVSAPGKVILHGEHSVVYDKLALAASLGLRTRLEFKEIAQEGKETVRMEFLGVNLLHFYVLQDIKKLLDKPIPLTKAPSNYSISHPELLDHDRVIDTVKHFIKEISGSHPLDSKQQQALTSFFYLFWTILGSVEADLNQFTLTIGSDLKVGAGTGSSASFAVAVVAFLFQYIRAKKCRAKSCYKNITKLNMGNVKDFDKLELELISKWAFQSEKIIHGTPSGVDNTICTFGGLVEFRRNTTPKLIEMSTKFTMILINTNVPRDTKYLVGKVATKREKYKMIIDSVLEIMDETAIKALEFLKKIDRRMGDEFDALELYETLGDLTDINQNLLRCLGVSHQKLDEVCAVLAAKGLHGKLTGAGGGGCAICMVPPYFDKEVVEKVIEELNTKGFRAVLTDLGGCGVSVD